MCVSPKEAGGRSARAVEPTPNKDTFILRLYIAGTTPQSTRAIRNARKFCENFSEISFELEVIDIYQAPNLANVDQIIAVPTLVKRLPPPLRKLVGDLSDIERIIVGLDLIRPEAGPE